MKNLKEKFYVFHTTDQDGMIEKHEVEAYTLKEATRLRIADAIQALNYTGYDII